MEKKKKKQNSLPQPVKKTLGCLALEKNLNKDTKLQMMSWKVFL